ncbi:hypothetical protein EC973_002703 [Apophysomyces ossiformis]|uniref:Uncharacterized protein n=1 Tax=Apophysomyces ossiformis TaxID=679940 RepID=A0A8H7BNE3_9FUNG|nr:hypothetical protein EC973_002703 [Apophysomyces ossiformis]
MRFGILFVASCFYLGVTVQAGVIPGRDGNHFVARAESVQVDRQREDFTADGHALEQVVVVKRQTNPTFLGVACGVNLLAPACQNIENLDGSNSQPGASGGGDDDDDNDDDAKGNGAAKDADND